MLAWTSNPQLDSSCSLPENEDSPSRETYLYFTTGLGHWCTILNYLCQIISISPQFLPFVRRRTLLLLGPSRCPLSFTLSNLGPPIAHPIPSIPSVRLHLTSAAKSTPAPPLHSDPHGPVTQVNSLHQLHHQMSLGNRPHLVPFPQPCLVIIEAIHPTTKHGPSVAQTIVQVLHILFFKCHIPG